MRQTLKRSHILDKDWSLVDTLPHTVELLTEELKLQLLLTQPLIAIKGYTDAGVEDASRRALALARQASHTGRLFAALGALFSVHFNRGEYRAASVLGREMLLLAETASAITRVTRLGSLPNRD